MKSGPTVPTVEDLDLQRGRVVLGCGWTVVNRVCRNYER